MPRLGRQVHGLEGTAGLLVDDVEALHQLQEVADFRVLARAPSVVEVVDEGGPANGSEDEVPAADAEVVIAVARAQREFAGDERELLPHQAPVDPHRAEVVHGLGAGSLQQLSASRFEEAHAAGFEDRERAVDDRLDLVGAQDLDGRVGVGQPRERQLPDRPGHASLTTAAAAHCHSWVPRGV